MLNKVPSVCGNSFGNSCEESGDYESEEEILEFSSEDERGPSNDFSDYLWMENEDEFEGEFYASLEEQELVNECLEAMAEMNLLDEIQELEADFE
jgi:hypothetical protein